MAIEFSALPFRAYNLIYNEWFRSQDLQDSVPVPLDDGPDDWETYTLLRRGKRHDYFTSALPWPQKGAAVTLPLGEFAPLVGFGVRDVTTAIEEDVDVRETGGQTQYDEAFVGGESGPPTMASFAMRYNPVTGNPDVYADLSEAAAVTINQLRQSFQVQRLLERNARGGTRYTELLRSHFGVVSPDARLQRPEYLGGGSVPVNISPIASTAQTDLPVGELAAIGTASSSSGFSQSFTEHGYIIGLAMVRADLTYQEGLHRMWSRKTRYDFYWPAFAHLGEQAILRKEIYSNGVEEDDNAVFGYQERWAEMRYGHSKVTGLFRSSAAQSLDAWHLAQYFDDTAPTLSASFIVENPPVERVLAVESEAGGAQFLFDSFIDARSTRPLPTYSVPGLIDHF